MATKWATNTAIRKSEKRQTYSRVVQLSFKYPEQIEDNIIPTVNTKTTKHKHALEKL